MEAKPQNISSKRLISLDAFRGLTIAGMIIVNNPGSWSHLYPPLAHAEWHGITPTDFVFPFFLYIVGVSIVLAYTKRKAANVTQRELVIKIIKRSLIIFALGIFLNLFPHFNFLELRIPGVLQRISLVFLACSLIFINHQWKTQVVIGAVLLIGYWLIMSFVPVPGEGKTMLEPGKNIAAWLDGLIIPGKMWQGTWDPEGLLSTLPAIATGITGMLIGKIVINKELALAKKAMWIFFAGFCALVTGELWGYTFPINKNIWTSSFVLYTSGLASLLLASFIVVIDILGKTNWSKFGIIYGANAITVYVLSGILPTFTNGIKGFFFDQLVDVGMAPKFTSLIWAILYCFLCFIPAYVLYKKKIFIKV
ncbi:MAG TPA: acyltransferase family protein [Cyclobacteriaceae bacterium]